MGSFYRRFYGSGPGWKGGSTWLSSECANDKSISRIYFDDFFTFGTSEKNVKKMYDSVYNAFVRKQWPAKPSKHRHTKKDWLTVRRVVSTHTEILSRILQN